MEELTFARQGPWGSGYRDIGKGVDEKFEDLRDLTRCWAEGPANFICKSGSKVFPRILV